MKKGCRTLALVLAACFVGNSAGNIADNVSAAENVVVSPCNTYEINDGVFEGWGLPFAGGQTVSAILMP